MPEKPRVDSCSMERLASEIVARVTDPSKSRGDLSKLNDEQLCKLNSIVAIEINRRFGEF